MNCTIFKLICIALLLTELSFGENNRYFEIQVVDDQTGRGVPLVELSTTNDIVCYTDSFGRVAFNEPGLMNKNIWFSVKSHGYHLPKDGFGFCGKSFVTKPGERGEIKLKRINRAERLYRITGQGIYADTIKLGLPVPIEEPIFNGYVMGQDSTQALIYKNKIFWFWGDTSILRHPLGVFNATGATSELEEEGGLDPNVGIDLRYFVDENNLVRGICPFGEEGVIWLDAPVVVNDDGVEKMIVHYSRMKSLGKMLEHGLAVYNDKKDIFEKLKIFNLERQWECPKEHAVTYTDAGTDYFLFPEPFAKCRVKANFQTLLDPNSYQTYTCLKPGTRYLKEKSVLNRNNKGELLYTWQTGTDPIGPEEERQLLKAGLIEADEARYQPVSVDSDESPLLVRGSLHWNTYRKKWIIIACEKFGKTSGLGEIWFSEADAVTGPWTKCWKIVTHDDYSFYNPVHHEFFDQEEGRIIYFEGTYTSMFSGTKQPTPRYNYNQIMYKLDLRCLE